MVFEIIILVATAGLLIIIARRLPGMIKDRPLGRLRVEQKDQKEVAVAPSSLANLISEADGYFRKGNFGQAESLYIQCAARDPKNPKIYNRLGAIYLEKKNFQDARDAFKEALRYDDTLASRHFNYAIVCLELKDYKNALLALDKAVRREPHNKKYKKLLEKISKKLS